MLTAVQCRALADEYKALARESAEISADRARFLTNIARTLTGLATQHDLLTETMREERRSMAGRPGDKAARPLRP